jgi:hypothetical protein
MTAINPSKKSIMAMIIIRIPPKRIHPAHVSVPATFALLSSSGGRLAARPAGRVHPTG